VARALVIEKFLVAFIPLFVAIDPIGLVALFIGLGTDASHENRKHQAFLGIFTGLLVSVGFIFLGKVIFAALGITVADFQVGGGLILLALAVRELVGFGPHDRGGSNEFGIVPLGMPLIAVALCNSERFTRWMGSQGLRGVSKIIALLLAAIAISLIRRGWRGA
jgi:multiple antibiotic resistance protein